MFDSISSFLSRKPKPNTEALVPEGLRNGSALRRSDSDRKQTFSKVFRWRLPAGQSREPQSVEVVGSFTDWHKVPLVRDSVLDAWHVSLNNIQSNRTHHYMILVDGQPTYDHTCDGMAVPSGRNEEAYQLMTDKGGRVLMLFGQTK